MPADERTRLRIRQHFTDLMNEELADAIMESMPPVPWSEITTKSDVATLEVRMVARFDQVDARLDHTDTRLDQVDARFDQVDARFDLIDGRLVHHNGRFDHLERVLSNELDGLEGRLSLRVTEAVRLVVVSIVLLFVGLLGVAAAFIASAG